MFDIEALIKRSLSEHGNKLNDFYIREYSVPYARIDRQISDVGDGTEITREDIAVFLQMDPNFIRLGMCDGQGAIDESKLPKDFGMTLPGTKRRLRCNLDRRIQGLDLTVRPIPDEIKPLRDLGLPEELYSYMDYSTGMLLFCGATGMGKSTTMASLIQYVNTNYAKKIITIEDPIEYCHEEIKSVICQREISRDEDFPAELRMAMRQSPDIIMVGEMRDRTTCETAIEAAETGHLVLCTTHAGSAIKTIDRITSMYSADDAGERGYIMSLLATVLRVIVVQRLIKNSAGQVRLAYEICHINTAMSQCIRTEKTQQMNNYMNAKNKCKTMEESLRQLVTDGHINSDEMGSYLVDQDQ